MKILMFSTDRNIMVEGAEARSRMATYGTICDELHIVLFAPRSWTMAESRLQISKNVFVYSTQRRHRLLFLWEGYRIAKKMLPTPVKNTDWVITAQDPFETGFIAYVLGRKFKVPIQIQVHVDFLSPYFWRESLKNKIRVLLAHFLIPRADGIRVVSARIKNQLQTTNYKLQTDPVVLPVFVDVSAIKDAETKVDLHGVYSSYDFIILMASRLTREKNIAMALEAMRQIILRFPKTLLFIVGSGPAKKMLSLLVERNCLEQNVIFSAWTNDITSYYKTADLFLLTSHYEGYGRTVVEAAAAGCPVVMTDVGLAGELVVNESSGFVVQVGDAEQLAQVLDRLLACPNELMRVLVKASEGVSRFPSREEYLSRYKEALVTLLLS